MKKVSLGVLGISVFLSTCLTVSAASMPSPDGDGKITLTDDIALTETFTVNEGETITLDLAGHTITGSADINYYTIENNGTLNIIDSGDNGKIVCEEDSSSCIRNNLGTLVVDGVYVESPFATIKNEADSTLDVKNSEIVSTHVGNSLSGGFTGALQNWGSATVDNTTITAASDYAVFARSGSDEGKSSDITIANSNLSGTYFVVTERTNSTTTTQTINISDSTLSGRASTPSGTVQSYSGDITLTTNHVSVNNTVIANSDAGTKITLDVDYNTCKALSQIAEKCDISLNKKKSKTTMCITKHSINVKYGYGSMYETLYADKQYYDREIEHYQETLDEYTNRKDKDFVVGTKQELIEEILEKIKQLECDRLNTDD